MKTLSYQIKWIGANDVDALVPEKWAMEGLALLHENMVVKHLVHTDYSNEIQREGDTVNTRKPSTFTAIRKTDADTVTVQDATVTNIPVLLDQHLHTSFLIKDGEESKSMKDLVAEFLQPAMLSIASRVDLMLLGQFPRFMSNAAGSLGTLTSTTAKQRILSARQVMNDLNVPVQDRNMIWNTASETSVLDTDLFLSAERVGDDGTALRDASLGKKLGFNHFMCQNMANIATGSTAVTGAVNKSGGYAAASTTIVVDGFSAAITAGSYVTIAGDMIPRRVASTVGGATPTTIVLATGLTSAVANDAVVTVYTPGAVNLSGGYAVGYGGKIAVDGFTIAPKTGQIIAFGDSTTTDYYTVMAATTTQIELDRPLATAISNDDAVCVGPAGEYNFFFRRNAISFVNRPLALPRTNAGALSAVMDYEGIALRIVITYDGDKQGHLVTCDTLCGVAQYDSDEGGVLFG